MYASDITRSFPANGKFTSFQKDIYSLVLRAQSEALKKMKIGNFISEFHNTAVKVICDGLRDLKIIKKSSDEILEKTLSEILHAWHGALFRVRCSRCWDVYH